VQPGRVPHGTLTEPCCGRLVPGTKSYVNRAADRAGPKKAWSVRMDGYANASTEVFLQSRCFGTRPFKDLPAHRTEGDDAPGKQEYGTYSYASASRPAGSLPADFCSSNYLSCDELSVMPKGESKIGPMNTQPPQNVSTMATPAQPMMPAIGILTEGSSPKRKPTRIETLRAAKAKITRRNSLRKQRRAQRDDINLVSGVDLAIEVAKER
jgi:hypothetical protein